MTRRKDGRPKSAIHALTKIYSGFEPDEDDEVVRDYFEKAFPASVEKPCGVLCWCPYGPIVEDFPLEDEDLDDFHALREPERCTVFGHYCPVFFRAEPFMDPEAVAKNLM